MSPNVVKIIIFYYPTHPTLLFSIYHMITQTAFLFIYFSSFQFFSKFFYRATVLFDKVHSNSLLVNIVYSYSAIFLQFPWIYCKMCTHTYVQNYASHCFLGVILYNFGFNVFFFVFFSIQNSIFYAISCLVSHRYDVCTNVYKIMSSIVSLNMFFFCV